MLTALQRPLRIPESELDLSRIYKTFDQFGPIHRVCFDKLDDPQALATYQHSLHSALSEISQASILDLIMQSVGLSMD